MFRRTATYFLFAIWIFLFNSCRKQNMCDCFKPRGETKLEKRVVANFTVLQVYDKIDVYYTQDTTATVSTVQIVTGKNLMSSITTVVTAGILQIDNLNKCNFVRGSNNDVTVYVTSPATNLFIQDGVGNIYGSNTIKADTVTIQLRNSGDVHLHLNTKYVGAHMHGVGDFYADGITNEYYSYSVGQGFIHAENLSATNSYIQYSSNGIAKVNVKNQLTAVLTSTGNVYYGGSPAVIQKTVIGSGKLIAD
jgi:transcriptional regulator